MEAGKLKKVKKLEEENAKLKRMYADLVLESRIWLNTSSKKAIKPCQKRAIVAELKDNKSVEVNHKRLLIY